MSDLEKLLKTVKKYYPKADLDLIALAYDYAQEAHRGQMRMNGEPYFTHAYATALKLAEWRMPPNIVIAGLLHDVPEDTSKTIEDLQKNFGEEVASMVAQVTKLSKVQYRGVERYIENLRKMFLAMAHDIRVVFIKFADRIHNLQTLDALPPEKQKRIALESLEIYAALANRLGMGLARRELEDLSFKYIYPKEYEWVLSLVKDIYPKKEAYLEKIKKIVRKDLSAAHIPVVDINVRVKGLYSLYKKLLRKDRDITKIYDLAACRIIVKEISDCYAALGILHARWKPLKGRIKDYIAQPKPNGYQSLHTTVFCEEGEIVEFQIRTEKMHEEAEFGIAAHWFYKERGSKEQLEKNLAWVKELAEIQKEMADRKKFLKALDSLKIDIFQNRIFVFTPHGDVLDLPEQATPVDFAYAIHSEIGRKCVGAKVNDEIAPLDQPLSSGDIVEIITDKNRKYPSPDWLKFVRTRSAREKIKDQLKKANHFVRLIGKIIPGK